MDRPAHRRFSLADNDALLTVAALVVGVVAARPFAHDDTDRSWALILLVASWLPLLVRNRWPLPVTVVVTVLDAVHIVVSAHQPAPQAVIPAATMLALYTVAVRSPVRTTWIAAVVAAVVQLTVTATSSLGASADALSLNWPIVATILGRLIAERRARIEAAEQRAATAEATKAAEALRQVTAERIRIAHELHDILAHHITVIIAQAGVAQYLLATDPVAAEKALSGIVENSSSALDELRATLGVLRTEAGALDEPVDAHRPAPSTTELPALVAWARDAGARATLTITGRARTLPTAADLAVYRITQEALTNAAKHAPRTRVEVNLAWLAESVVLTVTNSASVAAGTPAVGTGHGLLGIRERAAAAGGTATAEPTDDGGFRVRAELPTPPSPADRQGAPV